jgi:outer membrane protein assembly factor BamB
VQAALGLFGILALVVTYSIITKWNPLPAVSHWLDRGRTLSTPAPVWTIQVPDQPSAAALARGAVVISAHATVEVRRAAAGDRIWSKGVAWSAVAGADDGAVVVAGRDKRGYDALDPLTGAARWSDPTAIAAWTFTDLVVGMACPQTLACTLIAREPSNGSVRWQAELTGNGRPLAGVNKPLSAVRRMDRLATGTQPAPPLLGFALDDRVQVISTGTGRRLHSYRGTQTTRAVVADDRVIITTVLLRGGACRYTVEARDPDGDRQVWRRDGYDLQTASGLGCEQRADPLGGGGLLAAISGDNRPVLLDVSSGTEAYQAPAGQTIVATDGRLALVRTADQKSVQAIDVVSGATSWSREIDRHATLGVRPDAVLIADPGSNKLVVLSPSGGQPRLDANSGATVLGYADTGLVINIGRQVGLLTYRGAAG